jgi:uncharacterized protein (TIGR02145 family)
MKKTHFIASITFVMSNICISQSVTIGTQTWMTKNLSVSTFRNGDPIPEVKGNADWIKAGNERKPAWCYFHNDSSEGAIYGKLYNGWAVYDPRGLAPEGWHIPSMGEWDTLIYFLSRGYGKDRALLKMKTKSESDWPSYGYVAADFVPRYGNNSSGFSLIPNPYRNANSKFDGQRCGDQKCIMTDAFIWSSSIDPTRFSSALPETADSRYPPMIFSTVTGYRSESKDCGLVVRCVHD